ncbi:hypothetical protein J25TS5_56830 [Paenibacillus faecis]|uniref:response regulator n=1 Tax=Paenibacillus faecis TaxID=862114 RepID=UPI001B269DB4|nr:response regulator [Paenibacillus faecis]GIO88751.1 hypothetical protein J25TS5_56830 [Paenibacillus faecis]
MLRIAIVDDEASIREGLGKIIRRESEQYEVAGTFSNGQEALEFARSEPLDIVITDIRMPLMDGLELIKELKAVKPETRCIIMSGFTDFEYARQALRYSAVDYLLKPINKKQLFELLQNLEEEKAARLGKNLQLRSGLLISYMKSSPSLCPKLPELALPLPYFAVIVIKGSDMDALRSSVGLLQRQPQHLFDAVDTGERLISLVSYYADPPRAEDTDRLTGALRQFPHPGVVLVGVSRGYSDPARLGQAFAEAKLACERGMYREEAWSCEAFDAAAAEAAAAEAEAGGLLAAAREALVPPIQVLNVQETLHTMERHLDELRRVRASQAALRQYCRSVLETAAAELPEWRKAFGEAAAVPGEEDGLERGLGKEPGPGSRPGRGSGAVPGPGSEPDPGRSSDPRSGSSSALGPGPSSAWNATAAAAPEVSPGSAGTLHSAGSGSLGSLAGSAGSAGSVGSASSVASTSASVSAPVSASAPAATSSSASAQTTASVREFALASSPASAPLSDSPSAPMGTPDSLDRKLEACLKFAEYKQLLIGIVGRTLQDIREKRLAQGGKSVEVVKRWIEEHYSEQAELSSLAGLVYLTPTYLSKLFKQETGMTITDYLIEIRIKRAKQLLADSSNLKIHEVGHEVGYPDPAYFNKLFKRMVGVTPNEYKRISHSKDAPPPSGEVKKDLLK